MSSLVSACQSLAVLACIGAFSLSAHGQARFDLQGDEYRIVGGLQGDQVFPHAALNASGGFIVWQDNATDGNGSGISARRVNSSLSGALGAFRVNEGGAGDQTLPQVCLLQNGGAVFVWQSAVGSSVKVLARFLKPDGTFTTGDIAVSTYTGGEQTMPVITTLRDGSVVFAWSSIGQERRPDGQPVVNGMQGVFAQRFSPSGRKLGSEFQVNSTTALNQRTPDIATLANGNFVIVWVSEAYRGSTYAFDRTGRTESGAGVDLFDIGIHGQVFDPSGNRVGGELKLNSTPIVCANPSVVSTPTGFTVAWSGRLDGAMTEAERKDSWDIYARLFGPNGSASAPEFRMNTYTYGDQFRPKLSFQDGIHLILWTSLMQDGSWEGVVARLLTGRGQFLSREFRINTTTAGKQVYPTVAANGAHSFLTVWSSFVGGVNSLDLFAQRYASTAEPELTPPAAPQVSALSQTRLSVTWPELAGYSGVKYEVYVDDSAAPVVVENNSAIIVSLQPDSTHAFRLAYVLPDGRRSPLSQAATGKTWAEDSNYDGLPDDWQSRYWGTTASSWPGAAADSDGDGASNLQELLAGTDPTDPASVLRARMISTSQGPRLEWSSEPGCIYEVQLQNSADQSWVSLGTPRFAAGKVDSIPVDAGKAVALYRVIRVR